MISILKLRVPRTESFNVTDAASNRRSSVAKREPWEVVT